MYKAIEKKIKVIYKERRLGISNQSRENAVVMEAIGEVLPEPSSDTDAKKIKATYYRIARRFSLPTLSDLSKLQDRLS